MYFEWPDMKEVSQESIAFKSLTASHMDMLHSWFQVPHVKQWYARGEEYTLQAIKDKYLPRLNDKNIENYISLINQEPMGYIQIYFLPRHLPENLTQDVIERNPKIKVNKSIGLDIFFAKPEYLGKGISSQVLSMFLQNHMPNGINSVIVDPLKVNTKAISFFERNGFHKVEFMTGSTNLYLVRNF